MKSLQGKFLVASPHLADGNFFRSVVFLLQHNKEGAFGVVLNRPTENTVTEVWRMVEDTDVECDAPIFWGGPVEGPLLALHSSEAHAESEAMPGIWVASQKDTLLEITRLPDATFRLFAGYAGWSEGQLEDELKAGGWLLCPATAEQLFSSPDGIWEKLVSQIGQQIIAPTIKPKHVPFDPSMN